MAIVVVGSVAFDSLKTPFGEREKILGGSATYFSVAASFFTDVRVVAVVGDDFGEEEEAVFRERDVDLSDLERVPGQKSFFWKGEYGFDLNVAKTLDTQLNVFADFQPKLSAAARATPYLFLGNIQPTLQKQVREQVDAKLVAADTMNYWIHKTPDELCEMLKVIDVLIINDSEARELAGEANLIRAARAILSMGPKRLVVKRGEYGAAMFSGGTYFATPAYPLEAVFDPTGAGDTFAGGFMGYLAAINATDEAAMRQAIIYGSVMASFNVEQFGCERTRRLTYDEINARFRELKSYSHFEEVAISPRTRKGTRD
ncbi:MAG: PfkB family carbohydrate kinase [Blastocatellia bacterium]